MITKLLTKERAIELCIEMWTWLAKTGLTKEEWPRWPELIAFYGGEAWASCWLCEYDCQQEELDPRENKKRGDRFSCSYCPVAVAYGSCCFTAYDKWDDADTVEERKIYAAEFLDEIKAVA